jgi:cyclic 2,3-diphosphoglycerate synthase
VRTLALVDGEHYPPVVRAALSRAAEEHDMVAALLLGGEEKLRGEPDYGLPLERAGARAPGEAMLAAAAAHDAGRVLDLSDEPVLGQAERIELACRALAGGIEYAGPDFHFRPPPRIRIDVPTVAVIGTGKRVGKTAVSAHLARLLRESGRRVVVVAMGRGGPAEPELVEPGEGPLGVAELLARSHAGQHAASDFLEDAALAQVTTVGARRCGGGLFGRPYISNVGMPCAWRRLPDRRSSCSRDRAPPCRRSPPTGQSSYIRRRPAPPAPGSTSTACSWPTWWF